MINFSNEHIAYQADSQKIYFDYIQKSLDGFPTGVTATIGVYYEESGEKKEEVVSIRFNKMNFTVEQAKEWLTANKYKPEVSAAIADSATKKVYRFDKGAARSVIKLANGMMKVDAHLTRAGVFEYLNEDGTVRHELRTPEEVFNKDSLASLELATVTMGHPHEPVTADNFKQYAVGTVGENVKRKDEFVNAMLAITDGQAIKAIENTGQRELSCGYTADMDETSGVWNGLKYDSVQRNIRYNHVAIVDKGRAGPEVRMHMDGFESATMTVVSGSTGTSSTNEQKEKVNMVKLNIDGVDFEASEQLAQAYSKVSGENAKTIETLKAKLDAATEEVKKGKETHEKTISEMPGRVKERVQLEKSAAKVLEEAKLDEMSDLEIKKAVIAKKAPSLKLDDKSLDYIQARFDGIMEEVAGKKDENSGLADARAAAEAATTHADAEAVAKKNREELLTRWKRPIGVTKETAV